MRNFYYPLFTKVLVNGVYRAEVVQVLPATRENIERLYTISGFSSPEEWVETAKRIHRGTVPRHILVVRLLEH